MAFMALSKGGVTYTHPHLINDNNIDNNILFKLEL